MNWLTVIHDRLGDPLDVLYAHFFQMGFHDGEGLVQYPAEYKCETIAVFCLEGFTQFFRTSIPVDGQFYMRNGTSVQ